MRRKRVQRIAWALALMFLLCGCGSEGGSRNVQQQNAVESVIEKQIARESGKETEPQTEPVTEKQTEPQTEKQTEQKTEQNTEKQSETEVSSTETWASIIGEKNTESEPVSDEELMGSIRDSYKSDPDPEVDIDLTAMDSDMVYATVYQMTYVDPTPYEGKVFKAAGTFSVAMSTITDNYYSYVLVKDALACCAQGIEFHWESGNEVYPDDYPAEGSEIEVIGKFESYREDGDPNLYTRLGDAKMTIFSQPEKHEIKFEY